jgi:tetratricopeptide (TPR) repeat protein
MLSGRFMLPAVSSCSAVPFVRRPWFAFAALVLALGCSSTPPPAAPEEPPPSLEDDEPSGESEGFRAGTDAVTAGDFEKARGIFEKVTGDQPSNAKAHFYLGVAQQNLGQGDAAVQSYERALELDPKLTEATVNLTAALLDSGDAARAEPVIERGLASEANHPGLLYNRAIAAGMLGKKTEAVKAYRAALGADPNNLEIKYGYAEALVAAGSNSEARSLLAELTQADDVAVLASTARLLGRLEDFEGCIKALDKAILREASAELYVARGLCHHGKKDDASAYADFQQGIQKDPKYAPAHYYAGMDLKQRGKKAEAKKALARAAELGGDSGLGKAAKRALDSL